MSDSVQSAWLGEVVLSRRTVHDYSPEPIEDSVLEQALELVLAAPNHRMTEPWRFVVAGPVVRQRLADISVELKRRKAPLGERVEREVKDKIVTPPRLVVLCRVRHSKPDVEREDYAAIACGVQSAMLWLWSRGIGSKWSTGAVTNAAETYQALGVPEDTQEIVGFLWIGRPAKAMDKPRRKHGLADVLSWVP
jgi:nitroreductase